jgi:hypothetical protein
MHDFVLADMITQIIVQLAIANDKENKLKS